MWANIKYYALALVIILVTTLVSTALQLLEGHLPIGHPVSTLATNLSGVTLGTVIMVIGFLKDNRLDQERKRADDAITEAAAATAEAAVATAKAAAAEVVIQHERERADRYLAELERFRESYERTNEALIQLLRERDGNNPPNSGSAA